MATRVPIEPSIEDPGGRHEEKLRTFFVEVMGVPFTRGNRVRRLRNGQEIFPAMLQAIRSAERSIEFETFIYWRGEVAYAFARALRDAAERGVRVRILLDAVGSIPMSEEILAILEESPAEVRRYAKVPPWEFWKLDHRTHRKILVCDDRTAFTGGVGIAEEWEGNARDSDEWRETHFELQGPAARGMRGAFIQHWLGSGASRACVTDWPASAPDGRVEHTGGEAPYGDARAQVLRSSGGGRWSDTATLLRAVIGSAGRRLRITTAYFVPDDDLVELLCGASRRGVEVEIMVPGPHVDHRVCKLAGERTFARLMKAGVTLFSYLPTMLHTKTITVDGVLSVIGSANFNHRSMHRDDELAVVVLDRELAAALDEDFDRDLEACKELDDPQIWQERPLWRRLGARVSHLFRREL